jgi:NAD(P)-dependent dehydrogenase (short-subunit alcohol dehydrogenase family)
MGNRLENSVALITGASQGIGFAIAERFAGEGAVVEICSRRREAIESAAATIRHKGGSANATALDVADHDALAGFVRDVAARHGRLDVLVNNAPSVTYQAMVEMSLETFRNDFRINVDSTFVATREALKVMLAAQRGSIVNIASVNGLLATPNLAAYGAAKAAMIQLTRYTALEGARSNVRANAIAPGVIDTPATQAGFAGPYAEWGRKIAAQVPMGRFGAPAEVASVALFLASDESSYVTGLCLCVDGGKTIELVVPAP